MIQFQKLNKLAGYLEDSVNDEQFDLANFHNFNDQAFTPKYNTEMSGFFETVRQDEILADKGEGHDAASVAFKEGFCQTTACAIGFAPRVFPDELELHIDSEGNVEWLVGTTTCYSGYKAAEHLFELDYREVQWLFSPYNYDTWPKDRKGVADRIRTFVHCHGIPQDSAAWLLRKNT